MEWSYIATPFLAWLVAGISKFAINSIQARRLAFDLIGYGGMPSNHSAIVCSTAALIFLREGPAHPALGVAITVAFIVMLDANSLRNQVGRLGAAINDLAENAGGERGLRERMGHSRAQIAVGAAVGVAVACAVNLVVPA